MLDVIRKRRSVRSYLPRDVEEEKVADVLAAALAAPTAWGTRAWEFVVVRDPATREALSTATPYAAFVARAPVAVVVAYDPRKGKRFHEDASIAAEHIHLEAVHQGLGSCFVQIADSEGPHGDAEAYVKGVLGIPEEFRVQCIMPLGYPAARPEPHGPAPDAHAKVRRERWSGPS